MYHHKISQKVKKVFVLPMALLAIALPLIMPLTTENSMLVFLVGLSAFAYSIVFLLYWSFKKILGGSATFGFNPVTAYMTGNKSRKAGIAKEKTDAAMPETVQSDDGSTGNNHGRGDKNVHA